MNVWIFEYVCAFYWVFNPPPPELFLCPPGGVGSDLLLSRKRMVVERQARRHPKDLDEAHLKHFVKFKIKVTCQVKGRSKVKIGCIQVADRRDLKIGIFHPKLSISTPRTRQMY